MKMMGWVIVQGTGMPGPDEEGEGARVGRGQ